MKNVKITQDCKYAQSKPSLPVLKFNKDETYHLDDYLADSIINNGDGVDDDMKSQKEIEPKITIEPETKENPRKSRKAPKGK